MCKGQQSTTTNNTSTSTPNPAALAAYNSLLGTAQNVARTPFIPYSGQMVAPLTSEQNRGISGINQYANAAQPGIQQAEGLIGQSVPYLNESAGLLGQSANLYQGAAQPLTTAQINQYMNPYTQDVVNATEAQFNLQNAQQQNNLVGNAAAVGALGGNRIGVAQAQLAGQQQAYEAPVIAGLYNQAYQTGLGTAETEFQQNPEAAAAGLTNTASGLTNTAGGLNAAAYGMGNLAVSGQNAGLQGAAAQVQGGTLQQQTQQAIDQAAFNYYLMQAGFPEQQLNWESGIVSGIGSLMGGTNTGYGVTQGPTPSMFGPAAGLGIAALGAFAKDGGRIPEYDAGGAAPGIGLTPYGGGNMPYGGAPSYVPALQITHGSGPPKANPPSPQLPQQQSQGAFGGVDPKAIMSGYKGAGNLFGSNWAGGPDEGFDAGDVAGGFDIGAKVGGRIPHFDTGGAPDDDAGLLPPSSGWGMGSFPSADGVLPPSSDRPIQIASLAPSGDTGGVSPEHSTSSSMDEKRGVTVAMNGNAVPNGVLQDAMNLVKQGGSSRDLQSFMSRNGYPMDGNWCGEFAASVVHAAGGQPPPGAAVATNWMKFGRGVSPQDVHPGDVAVLTRGHGVGETGGHVGFVSEVDPQHGRFSLLGGNQGQAVKTEPMAGFQFRRGDYSDTPAGVASTNTVDPSGAGEAEARGLPHVAQAATPGVANDSGGFLGLHLSDAARQGLIGAGLGMMASGSPYPLQQIGQGGLQGLQAYGQAKTRDLAVQRLGIEADKARALIAKEHEETANLKTTGEMQREKLNLYRGAPGQSGTAPVSPVQVQPVAPPTPPPAAAARGPSPQGQTPAPPAAAPGVQPPPQPVPQAQPKPTVQLDPNWDPAALEAYAKKVAPLDPALAQTYRDQANKIITSGMTRDINGNVIPLPGYAESKAANEAPGEVQKLAVKTGQDRLNEINTAARQAADTRQSLDLEKSLVNDPNFIAGAGTGYKDALARIGVGLGISNPDRATPGEVYDKLRSSSILNQIRGMKGTGPIRVAEMQFIDKMIAGRENSPQSIRDLVEIEDRAQKRVEGVQHLAQQYLEGHPYLDQGFEGLLTAWLNDPKHAMFSPEELQDPRLIAPPVFKNEAQFKAAHLPRGYPFKVQGLDGVGYAQ